MPQILIPESEIQEYADFLNYKLKQIDEKIIPLQLERKSIERRLNELTKKPVKTAPIDTLSSKATGLYDENGTILSKIKFVLGESTEPMMTREIIDRLFILEPRLKKDTDKVSKNISTVLSIHNGKTFSRETKNKTNFFTLK